MLIPAPLTGGGFCAIVIPTIHLPGCNPKGPNEMAMEVSPTAQANDNNPEPRLSPLVSGSLYMVSRKN